MLNHALATLIGTVVYTWIVYPLLLLFFASFSKRKPGASQTVIPFVSIIIAVHNEERTIESKLRDCSKLLYPTDRIEIIVASDGSSDRTEEIVLRASQNDSRIRWIASEGRLGKSGIQNLAADQARGDLLLFTDAETSFAPKALQSMVDKLADPEIGLVTATVMLGNPEDDIEKSQGFYWRYELLLRNAESDIGMLATGSGQALLLRRELFRHLPGRYGDDCVIPIDIRLQGYRVIQDRGAIVFDTMPHSIEGELRVRIRMTARNWTGTLARSRIFNPFRFPLTAVGLVSHKLLRWLTPLFLIAIFLLSFTLRGNAVFFLMIQSAFYISALAGWQMTKRKRNAGVLGYSFSFCLANVGFLLGIIKALLNETIVAYR